MKKLLLLFCLLFLIKHVLAQLPYGLIDNRENQECKACIATIDEKPKEVLFGLEISRSGDIYFMMDDIHWFHKIFDSQEAGITIDIISKDQYKCNAEKIRNGLPKGRMIQPVYKKDLEDQMEILTGNTVYIKIGKIPDELQNKELEGNLIIVRKKSICYYSNFVNIDRSDWNILPMGLFTDTLLNNPTQSDDFTDLFGTKKITLTIPFQKNSSLINKELLKTNIGALHLKDYIIDHMELRTFASVEGSEKRNTELLKDRSNAILSILNLKLPPNKIRILNSENWLEFYNAMEKNENDPLSGMSKKEIKLKLLDTLLKARLEYILKEQRKSIVSFYVKDTNAIVTMDNDTLIQKINKSLEEKKIDSARFLQKELIQRIQDNQIPNSYLNKIEVPEEKEYSPFINDNIVFRLLLKSSSEYEALEQLKVLFQLDSTNNRLKYNICALEFFIWNNDQQDSVIQQTLFQKISQISKETIDSSLIKRMMINFWILKSRDEMAKGNYNAKDSLIERIATIYNKLQLDDADLYSLAKYYAYYSHNEKAMDLITPRIKSIDISEDLVFFYLNLLFFDVSEYQNKDFNSAMLNAVNLNRSRFCKFFKPNHSGGASMQLLDAKEIKQKYCESCLERQ